MKCKTQVRKWFSRLVMASMLSALPTTLFAQERYAFLMGVNDYSPASELQPLRYAASDVKSNEGLIRDLTAGTASEIPRNFAQSQSTAMTRPIGDGRRLEKIDRAIGIYDTAAGIANQFGADLPSIPRPSSFIPGGIGRFLPF